MRWFTLASNVENPAMPDPFVVHRGFLSMQVCVPRTWTDAEAIQFAEANNPCDTAKGWQYRTALCADDPDMVHVVLDAWPTHRRSHAIRNWLYPA